MWRDLQYEKSLYFWDVLSPRERTALEVRLFWLVARGQARKTWRRLIRLLPAVW